MRTANARKGGVCPSCAGEISAGDECGQVEREWFCGGCATDREVINNHLAMVRKHLDRIHDRRLNHKEPSHG